MATHRGVVLRLTAEDEAKLVGDQVPGGAVAQRRDGARDRAWRDAAPTRR